MLHYGANPRLNEMATAFICTARVLVSSSQQSHHRRLIYSCHQNRFAHHLCPQNGRAHTHRHTHTHIHSRTHTHTHTHTRTHARTPIARTHSSNGSHISTLFLRCGRHLWQSVLVQPVCIASKPPPPPLSLPLSLAPYTSVSLSACVWKPAIQHG